ncbi:MAG TPA: hypothetical protein VNF71_03765 [Acidimicrobiales bacterium]|nr:hypothetical protein [Acidimicrobiales bacterium]
MIKVGARLACPDCPAEVVVTRAAETSATLACSGCELVALDAARPQGGHASPADAAPQLGKRYVDDDAGLELLCTKPGTGELTCDGRALSLKAAKPLPSSD